MIGHANNARSAPRLAAPRVAIVLLVVYAVFWAQFAVVRAENFGGIDEWLILSLVSRGAIDIPYANRPLGLLFNLPVALFPSHLLEVAFLLHGHYLVLSGLLTSLLLLRLAPDRPDWSLLAGTLAATWAPSDRLRLDSIYSAAYSGVTATTALIVVLLLAGIRRPVLVVVAAGLGFVTSRVHEGALPVLLLAPFLLWALGARLGSRPLAAYCGVMGLAAVVAGLPLLRGRPESWYQGELLGVYLDPLGLMTRLGLQFRLHLAPLLTVLRQDVFRPHVLAIGAALSVALAFLKPPVQASRHPRRFVVAALVGLVGAASGYSGFVLAARMVGADRAEMLAAPWIGLALASIVALLAEVVPAPARRPLVVALGAFVATAGAARTVQLQQVWNQISAYDRQAGDMRQIAATAADFKPGTLVILFQGTGTWVGTFAFHHALDVVYGRHVAGCVANGREELFYECRQDAQGVHHDPWPVLKPAWGASPRTYRFDEVVVFRSDATGRITLVDEWPADLPPLPAGATYAPQARITSSASSPVRRSILARS